jgi:hypothetical protein
MVGESWDFSLLADPKFVCRSFQSNEAGKGMAEAEDCGVVSMEEGSTASVRACFSLLLFLLVFMAGRTCWASFWSTCWASLSESLNCPASGFAQGKRAEKR